jgi:hypothetical protein
MTSAPIDVVQAKTGDLSSVKPYTARNMRIGKLRRPIADRRTMVANRRRIWSKLIVVGIDAGRSRRGP